MGREKGEVVRLNCLKTYQSLWWSLLGALIAGCSSSSPINADMPASAGRGAVVLKLLSDGRASPDFADAVVYAVVVREGDSTAEEFKRVRLTRTNAATNTSAVLGGFASPGRYRLGWIETQYLGRGATFHLDPDLLQFDVKPGTVSVLGTLLIQAPRDPLVSLQYVPLQQELIDTIARSFPELKAWLQEREPQTAESSELLKQAAVGVKDFKLRPGFGNSAEQMPNGDFVVTSRLGRFFMRKRGSVRWQAIDVGAWGEVMSVRPYRGGLLVAGEEGMLRYSNDMGSTWRILTPPGPGMIRVAQPLSDGKVLAVVRYASQWAAYVSQDPTAEKDWQKIASFDFDDLPGNDQPSPVLVSVGDKVGLMLANGSFRLVDPHTGQILKSSSSVRLTKLSATQDGLLILRGYRDGHVTLVSYDEGASWRELKLPVSTLASTFKNWQTFYALSALHGDTYPQQFAIMTSRDGGASWVRTGVTPGEPSQLGEFIVDRLDGSLIAQMRGGAVMRSSNEGATWVPDF